MTSNGDDDVLDSASVSVSCDPTPSSGVVVELEKLGMDALNGAKLVGDAVATKGVVVASGVWFGDAVSDCEQHRCTSGPATQWHS